MNAKEFLVYAIGDMERRVVTMGVEVLYNFIANVKIPLRIPENATGDWRVLEIHTIHHKLRGVHAMKKVEVVNGQMVVGRRRVVEREVVQKIER